MYVNENAHSSKEESGDPSTSGLLFLNLYVGKVR